MAGRFPAEVVERFDTTKVVDYKTSGGSLASMLRPDVIDTTVRLEPA